MSNYQMRSIQWENYLKLTEFDKACILAYILGLLEATEAGSNTVKVSELLDIIYARADVKNGFTVQQTEILPTAPNFENSEIAMLAGN